MVKFNELSKSTLKPRKKTQFQRFHGYRCESDIACITRNYAYCPFKTGNRRYIPRCESTR